MYFAIVVFICSVSSTFGQLFEYGRPRAPDSGIDVFNVPQTRGPSLCYDVRGRAQRCIPSFVNAAFNREVEATNTCGIPPIQFCSQTGVTGARKECDICDARDHRKSHPARFLTDFAREDANDTWWQSETMLQGVQYPNGVNLTLNLRKAFDITYVRLRFHTSVPESFAVYKQKCESCPWTPLQFYSASCETTYGLRNREIIRVGDEQKALCTNEFSDISPLTGGSIPFSTLEGRPSRDNFDNSPVLQDWVSATGIRIALNRLNTFGDEVFGDPKVLKSYYYAISDFAVGGRCKCNGHAAECVNSTGLNLEPRLVCRCEHNTTGPDCGECLPFYQDRPWAKASLDDAQECKICNCNGLSNRCFFDDELYRRTGSGGHCLDCQRNTAGPHCERCKEDHYRNPENNECQPCYCNPVGSRDLQCDDVGRCVCKQGVGGEKCDRCLPNFYDFSNYGCRSCACDAAGSLNNNPSCEVSTGVCRCKDNVEAQNCDRCKPGFFNLDLQNEFGCMACFCFGHSSQCVASKEYAARDVVSDFDRSSDGWTSTDDSGQTRLPADSPPSLTARATPRFPSVYFSAPSKFLGDQKFSYNQLLKFRLKVSNDGARATRNDVVLEGSGFKISAPIFAQGNKLPNINSQQYSFRLHEHPNFQWTPRLQTSQFQRLLANVTALRVRGTFSPEDVGQLDDVQLESARRGEPLSGQSAAPWVEECTCPLGYVGQFCESCQPGFRREPTNGGPFSRCVPCNCNGHSHTCDVDTGRCICQHNTVGDNCERCAPGFYGYALRGQPDDCRACPCPQGGECVENPDGEVVCTNCADGYTGARCDSCADGFFGDLRTCDVSEIGNGRCTCSPCACSGNFDRNAVGNCDRITGQCLKCIYNTRGFNCERCEKGFYGNALSNASPLTKCKRCNCYDRGTARLDNEVGELQCQQATGQCPCLPHVVGRQCDKCESAYWNLDSGRGCEMCACDPTGSLNSTCDLVSGQCHCKPGVAGRACNQCVPGYYGFSPEGCRPCNCDRIGSASPQCDETGQCPCRDNVVGRKCDRCAENMFGLRGSRSACEECPPCYGLIQDRVNRYRASVERLKRILAEGTPATRITDEDFERVLRDVVGSVGKLFADAGKVSNDEGSFGRFTAFLKSLEDLKRRSRQALNVSAALQEQKDFIVGKGKATRETLDRIEELLSQLKESIRDDGKDSLQKARGAQLKMGEQAEEMGRLRDESRSLAAEHVDNAAAIEARAKEALNTSEDAMRMARDALTKGEDVDRQLKALKRSFDEFDSNIKVLRDESLTLYKESKKCRKNAEEVASSLQNEVPSLSAKKVKEQSADVTNKAESIEKAAERLQRQHKEVIAQVYDAINEARLLFEDTVRLQQVLDELLGRSDVALNVAKEAKAKAEAILEEGKKTLEILKNFDNEVNASRSEAEEALSRIGEIQALIRDAETKTRDANEGLIDAGKRAESSFDDAKEAGDIADVARVGAEKNADILRETVFEAERVRDKTETLSGVVNDTERSLRELENRADSDSEKAVDSERIAAASRDGAQRSTAKAAEVLRDLERILRDLADLSAVHPVEIERLKADLEEGEDRLREINLEKVSSRLEIGARQQEQWIADYMRQVTDLERDVINVEEIRASLPEKCYNYISIEQGNGGRT